MLHIFIFSPFANAFPATVFQQRSGEKNNFLLMSIIKELQKFFMKCLSLNKSFQIKTATLMAI